MDTLQKIVSFSKRRGFIFPCSEIYGGVSGIWEFGHLGALMKQNLRNYWIKRFVFEESNIVLIDGAVIMHPKVWKTSGHLENFTDLLSECRNCHKRFRTDHLVAGRFIGEGKAKKESQCPECGGESFTKPRNFNLMFKTFLGSVEDSSSQVFLRPETAQSMFVNFKNVLNSNRLLEIPFGIAQIGKCFRNEITTGDFIFRVRELEIAEIEFFVKPGDDEKYFEIWLEKWEKFFLDLGIKKENLRRFEHPKESLAHYSKRTIDIEYRFPFGWGELAGIANRTDYDLNLHEKASGEDLNYFDIKTKTKYHPFVIEPTMGLERIILALLIENYKEIKGGRKTTTETAKEKEILLSLPKEISPIKVGVLPLVKNKPEIVKKAKEIYQMLKPHLMCQYDEIGSIGRRYRRQDEIGTPWNITVDFQTLEDDSVTVRERDSMEQERIYTNQLQKYFFERLNNFI